MTRNCDEEWYNASGHEYELQCRRRNLPPQIPTQRESQWWNCFPRDSLSLKPINHSEVPHRVTFPPSAPVWYDQNELLVSAVKGSNSSKATPSSPVILSAVRVQVSAIVEKQNALVKEALESTRHDLQKQVSVLESRCTALEEMCCKMEHLATKQLSQAEKSKKDLEQTLCDLGRDREKALRQKVREEVADTPDGQANPSILLRRLVNVVQNRKSQSPSV